MAMPIAATQPLTVKEAKKFLRALESDLKRPKEIIRLPDMAEAEKRIMACALKKT